MDQPQPRGDFYAPMNRNKQPGDTRPMFQGRLTKPGDDAKHPFQLWAHPYVNPKTGEHLVSFSGNLDAVSPDAMPMDQIHALLTSHPEQAERIIGNLKLTPGQVVLFPNGFKAEAPEKGRPDYWGWAMPHDGTEPFKLGVWLKKFEDGRTYMSGSSGYPIPGKSEAERQDALTAASRLVSEGVVAKGSPKGKGRGRDE